MPTPRQQGSLSSSSPRANSTGAPPISPSRSTSLEALPTDKAEKAVRILQVSTISLKYSHVTLNKEIVSTEQEYVKDISLIVTVSSLSSHLYESLKIKALL